MGPNTTGTFNEGQPKPTSSEKRRVFYRKIKIILKKFWYVLVIVLVAIAVLITLAVLDSNAKASWQKATDYFSRAEYENAAKIIKDMPVPNDQERLRVYSQTMLATGELDKALTGYSKLYEITKDTSSKLIIGNIYNQQKKYDQAITVYREVIAENSSNVQAYVNLATVYRLQGKNGEAVKIANESVKNNPNSVTLLELKVSMLLDEKGSDAYNAAVEELKKANPQDPLLQALNSL